MFSDVFSKKRCIRYFAYHLKVHTISNKLVLKGSAKKKGEKCYDSYNMCSNFSGFRCSFPLKEILFVFFCKNVSKPLKSSLALCGSF